MNKGEFLHTLEMSLNNFNEKEKKEILYDYEEHFRIGEQSGKNEDELITELGDPDNIANQYKASNQQEEKADSKDKRQEDRPIMVPIIAAIGLLLFNLIFIIGPFIGIAGTIVGLFAATIGLIIAGIGMAFGMILLPLFPQYISITNGISGFGITLIGIGTVALGLLLLIGMYYISKFFYKGTIKYVNWNLKIIKG